MHGADFVASKQPVLLVQGASLLWLKQESMVAGLQLVTYLCLLPDLGDTLMQ